MHAYVYVMFVPQEAAVSAGAETERRLRDEMEREKGLALGLEGSVSALTQQLQVAKNEVSEKEAAAAELKSRLEEVQVWQGNGRGWEGCGEILVTRLS